MEKKLYSINSFWKDLLVAVVAAIATVMVSKTCERISPEENKVIISDTLRVVEASAPRNADDSLLYLAISELNKTLQETAHRNNSIKIVWPEPEIPSRSEIDNPLSERAPSIIASPLINYRDNSALKINDKINNSDDHSFVNKIVDKKGFYKKGYTISDGGVFYVLEKMPKVDDKYLIFEINLIQSADLLSHIYLNICSYNEKGELYQYFSQTYEIRDGLNRVKVANNLRNGKSRIEIGVFLKSDEGKEYPTYYRNVFTLVK